MLSIGGYGLAALLVIGVLVLSFLVGRMTVTVRGLQRDYSELKRRMDSFSDLLGIEKE